MIYWQLFSIFFVIGLFCFGGGYAILPFIQDAVVGNGWLTMHEFGDIIAVAESTPGPVSINTATFVGFKMAGVPGAVCATFSLCLPAFLLVMTVVKLLYTKRGEYILNRLLVGIRPVVVGMIFYAAWSIGETVFFQTMDGAAISFNALSGVIAITAMILSGRFKISPIKIIIGASVIGLVMAFL